MLPLKLLWGACSLLPGAPSSLFPCLFEERSTCKGVPAFLLAVGSSQLHDLTQYNEEMDRKVNKTCPELDGKWQLPGLIPESSWIYA